MDDKKNILVTGGAGYIGSHTVVALIENGFHPVIVDDFRNSQTSVISNLEDITQSKIEYYNVDCCDLQQLQNVFKKHSFSGIIHFAAFKAVGESVDKPLMYYQNNLISLMNILELANDFKVNNIVFSSSCTVYGDPVGRQDVDEDTPLQTPSSPYGKTKMMSEHILEDYQKANTSANIYALRYFNPIGAHPTAKIGELPIGVPNNLVPFVTQTAAGIREVLTVFGKDYPTADGTCIRDFIHVMDLAEAHVAALQNLYSKNGYFDFVNLGTGKGTSVQELIDVFEKVTETKLNYVYGNRRPGDVVAIYADATKSKTELNWVASRSLEESILSAWQWQKNLQQ